MLRQWRKSSALAFGLMLSFGCSTPAPLPAAPVSATARVEPQGFGRGVEVLVSDTQGVQFPLPGAATWRVSDGGRMGFVATHAATRSRLSIRAFRDAAFGRGESCEAQARAADASIPRVAAVIERRRSLLAPDFELALSVSVEPESAAPDASGLVLHGHVLAFGGDGRRCLAVVFSTVGSGAHADTLVAGRLALIVESTFTRMRLRAIDQRVLTPRL